MDALSKEQLLLRLAGLGPSERGTAVRGYWIDADAFRSSEPRSDLKANLDGLWLAVSLLEDRLRESGE